MVIIDIEQEDLWAIETHGHLWWAAKAIDAVCVRRGRGGWVRGFQERRKPFIPRQELM